MMPSWSRPLPRKCLRLFWSSSRPVAGADTWDVSGKGGGGGRASPPGGGEAPAAAALEELEMTRVAPPDAPVRVEPLAGLEHTRLPADRAAQSQWTAEAVPLERTQHEVDAEAQGAWEGEIEVDPGREPDSGERTPLPAETAICPWCGAASLAAICDGCGRRKARVAGPPPQERERASEEGTLTCPACFARVAREERCSDCGTPFPLQEL